MDAESLIILVPGINAKNILTIDILTGPASYSKISEDFVNSDTSKHFKPSLMFKGKQTTLILMH